MDLTTSPTTTTLSSSSPSGRRGRGALRTLACAALSLAVATATLLPGCTVEGLDRVPSETCTEDLCLPLPASGFQIGTAGVSIAPGEDVEYCEVVALPGSPRDLFHVDRFESAMTPGSHHLLVAAIVPGSETDRTAEVGDRVPCFGTTAFGEDLVDVTGQQAPLHEERFPPGVGRVYRGGQKIVFDYHYLNATDQPMTARAVVNFHVVPPGDVDRIATTFGRLFADISVPPRASRSYDVECRMTEDVMVHKLVRHTHRWGREFPVSFLGGARDGQPIFTSQTYEDAEHTFPEPVMVRAGEGFRFTCNYTNDTDQTLVFGEKATDEMCILFGTIYPVEGRELPPWADCD